MANAVVRGIQVDEQWAARKSAYEGRPCYFCSTDCQLRFEADPARYSDVRKAHHGATYEPTAQLGAGGPCVREGASSSIVTTNSHQDNRGSSREP
jgi:YHS domain-containing protein